MRSLLSSPATATPLPGVIDTFSAGYRLLNRHLWLLALPVLFDLFYWLGPRLTVSGLTQRLAQSVGGLMAAYRAAGMSEADATRTADLLQTELRNAGQTVNTFSVLSTGLPSVSSLQSLPRPPWQAALPAWDIAGLGAFAGILALFLAAALLVAVVYLALAAQVVRKGRLDPRWLVQNIGRYARTLVLLVLGLMGILLLLGLPVALATVILSMLSGALGLFILMLLEAALLWSYFYLFFAIDAIFISDSGPGKAVANSVAVVRGNVPSALGFFAVSLLIAWGMSYVWSTFGQSAISVFMAIVGNAYIGTGLWLAEMIFYRDRMVAYQAGRNAR